MSSIEKRRDRRDSWRARYRDDAGRQHSKHFTRKVDAQRWLDEVTTSMVSGQYVAPDAGRVTFKEYAELWRKAQVHRPTSQAHVETMLRRHAYPTLGARPLSAIRPGDIQLLVAHLSAGSTSGDKRRPLAPTTVGVVHGLIAAVFKAAVRDRRVASNPCEGTRLPKIQPKRVDPLTTDQVQSLTEATPDHLRALVTLAAGTGMRQGECLGLTVDRVDFLRQVLRVDRQLVALPGSPLFLGPPKTTASCREIPLPQVVIDALAAHLAEHPASRLHLPDGGPEAELSELELIFTTEAGKPWRRSGLGVQWRTAVKAAGIGRPARFHDLRHYYASLLIRHGESVKTVQTRLGHATAAETLDTYSHLWPDSDDRTRAAVDSVLGAPVSLACPKPEIV